MAKNESSVMAKAYESESGSENGPAHGSHLASAKSQAEAIGESASGENGENNGAARRISAAGGAAAAAVAWQRIVSMAAAKAAMAAVAVSAARNGSIKAAAKENGASVA
jgi:hypothetical protein